MERLDVTCIKDLLKMLNLENYQKHEHFHIMNLENHYSEMPVSISHRIINFFEFAFTPDTTSELIVDGQSLPTGEHTLLFLSPGQSLQLERKANEQNSPIYICHFTYEFLRLTISEYALIQEFPFLNIQSKPNYLLNEEQTKTIQTCIKRMYSQFNNIEKTNIEIIRSFLIILLYETRSMFYKNQLKTLTYTRAEEISHNFEMLIQKTPSKKKKMSWYASQLCISPAYLLECVKKATGRSPKKILIDYLIMEAKSLLLEQGKTIQSIAELQGFDDTSNFINFFKKYAKVTPGSFRRTSFKSENN